MCMWKGRIKESSSENLNKSLSNEKYVLTRLNLTNSVCSSCLSATRRKIPDAVEK